MVSAGAAAFLVVSLATIGSGLPQAPAPDPTVTIDPDNPNNADPNPLPKVGQNLNGVFPSSPDPWPNGIPVLPADCDFYNMTDACFAASDVNTAGFDGAKLRLDKNHNCTEDQQSKLKTGFWEATDILNYVRPWQDKQRGKIAAEFWFGANWPDFSTRLKGNIDRASGFLSEATYKNDYIVVTCADPKNWCKRNIDEKAIGGYAWNEKHSLEKERGYINMCTPYFGLSTVAEKEYEISGYLAHGQLNKVRDMRYYSTLGMFISHEMMHLHTTWNGEPAIHDQFVSDIAWNEPTKTPNDYLSYGPERVRQLAKRRSKSNTFSGVDKSSQNADSYAIFASSLYWWDVNGVFPGVPTTDAKSSADAPEPLVMVTLDLGDSQDAASADLDALFDQQVARFTANFDDPDPGVLFSPDEARCLVNVTEIWTCADDFHNLFANVTLVGPDDTVVYQTKEMRSINDQNPLNIKVPGLNGTLEIIGEHTNDYIHFTYQNEAWDSKYRSDGSYCLLIGNDWDTANPPFCDKGDAENTRQWSCVFPCS